MSSDQGLCPGLHWGQSPQTSRPPYRLIALPRSPLCVPLHFYSHSSAPDSASRLLGLFIYLFPNVHIKHAILTRKIKQILNVQLLGNHEGWKRTQLANWFPGYITDEKHIGCIFVNCTSVTNKWYNNNNNIIITMFVDSAKTFKLLN